MQPGAKRHWILLRGLAREQAHWGPFVGDLAHALPQDDVTALDLPGNGLLHRQPSPCSVPAMVQACRRMLAERGVAPPYHLLAMSLGAMVATEWAHATPAEVAGCVLINTSLRPFSPFHQRLRPGNYAALLRVAAGIGSPQSIERQVLRMTSHCAPDPPGTVQAWVDIRAQRPVSAANALRQLVAAARYQAPAAAPQARVLLLASRHDALVSSQCSVAIAAAWHAPLEIHPRAGHDLPLDDAAWVIAQVQAWLAQARAGDDEIVNRP